MLDSPSPNQSAQNISSVYQPQVTGRSLGQRPSTLIQADDAPEVKASTLGGATVESSTVSSSIAYYIQAIVLGQSSTSLCPLAFLTTNVSSLEDAKVTDVASTWLIGRSNTCAIAILHPSISRCHAVIGYSPTQGFYITDVGSSNGTAINRQRIPISERRSLMDGDLISLSQIHIEFFVSHQSTFRQPLEEIPDKRLLETE